MQSRFTFNIPRFAVAMMVSLMLAFMPFTVNLEKYRITLERNEAHAIAPVFVGALAFLEECAAAAGFATVGEFIATGAGITAVASGMTIGTAAGIQLGDSASQNLNNLVDAADYPSWDTLSSSEKSNWVSEENYNAAKYNSLMSAFGLNDDYENYKNAWGSGDTENFVFSSSAQTNLEKIGDIGQNWISGAGNTLESILSSGVCNKQQVISWFPLERGTCSKSENDTDWPSGLPENVYYTINADYQVGFNNGTDNVRYQKFSSPVYTFSYQNGSNISFINCSLNQYSYGYRNNSPDVTLDGTASNETYADTSFYTNRFAVNGVTSNPIPDNGDLSNVLSNSSNRRYICAKILTGGVMSGGPVEVSGYPDQEIENDSYDPDIVINFPTSGITDETTWNELVKHTQNVDDDLDSVIALLQHIDSDLHNLNIPGATDLTPVINKLQNIDNHIQGLDFLKAADLQPLITSLQHVDSDLHKFAFYQSGELKVHDEGVYTELSDIYALLFEIEGLIGSQNDIPDAPDIIGDFDFDDIDDKIPNLLDTIKDLAPFGSVLLLSEIYTILSHSQIEDPVMVFPFDFGGLPGQDTELTLDLSWLDDIKPVINFFCILMLVLAIAHATIRIVEIEAAS